MARVSALSLPPCGLARDLDAAPGWLADSPVSAHRAA